MSKPFTYIDEEHPSIEFDRGCKKCSLSTKKAVQGAGPNNLSNVKLIIISDHPGDYEERYGYPFYDNSAEASKRKKNKYGQLKGTYEPPGFPNAGSYIRQLIHSKFGLDTYNEVWCTNVVKCNPRGATIGSKHLRTCVRSHLIRELTEINNVVPNVPILIAGRHAFDGIGYLDKTLKKQLGNSLREVRRTNSYKLWSHPLVFTFNPASVRDNEFRIEKKLGFREYTNRNKHRIRHIYDIRTLPELPGSPRWIFNKDIEYLRELLIPTISN